LKSSGYVVHRAVFIASVTSSVDRLHRHNCERRRGEGGKRIFGIERWTGSAFWDYTLLSAFVGQSISLRPTAREVCAQSNVIVQSDFEDGALQW